MTLVTPPSLRTIFRRVWRSVSKRVLRRTSLISTLSGPPCPSQAANTQTPVGLPMTRIDESLVVVPHRSTDLVNSSGGSASTFPLPTESLVRIGIFLKSGHSATRNQRTSESSALKTRTRSVSRRSGTTFATAPGADVRQKASAMPPAERSRSSFISGVPEQAQCMSAALGGARRALGRLPIRKDDARRESRAAGDGDEEEDHREAGIAEDAERRLDAHQERRPDDERGEDEAERDPVRDLLDPRDQLALVDRVDVHPEGVRGDEVEDLLDALGKPLEELARIEDRGDDVLRRRALAQAPREELGGVPPDRGVRVERRIERPPDLVEVEERLSDHRELRRELQARLGREARDVHDDAAELEVAHGRVLEDADELDDAPRHLLLVELGELVADLLDLARRLVAVPLAHGDHEPQELVAQRGGEARDHAEIEEGDAAVVREKDVSGMRVGVEEAVEERLLEVGPEELLGEGASVDVELREGAQRGDLLARDEVHRENARRRVVVDRLRHDDVVELREGRTESDHVLGFLPVVELLEESLAELFEHRLDVEGLGVSREDLGDLAEGLEVVGDLFADAGPLHLDGDATPVPQRRPVDLAQRGRCGRLLFEARERLRDPRTELGLHDLLDLPVREGLDLVLEPVEALEVGRWEEVGAGGEELADLHERRAQALEIRGELGGLGASAPRSACVRVRRKPETPVFQRERRDVFETLEVSGLERQGHRAGIPPSRPNNVSAAPCDPETAEGKSWHRSRNSCSGR